MPPVTVFCREGCRPCELVKAFLSRAAVPFVVRDVDVDEDAYDEVMRRGWRAVPVCVIGDRFVRGFDPMALGDALRAAGTPGTL
jgi:glutaredoxin